MTWGRSPFTETLPTPQSQIARIKVGLGRVGQGEHRFRCSCFVATLHPAVSSQLWEVVSYNLEWWKIYNTMKGNGGSEGGVIAATHAKLGSMLTSWQQQLEEQQ